MRKNLDNIKQICINNRIEIFLIFMMSQILFINATLYNDKYVKLYIALSFVFFIICWGVIFFKKNTSIKELVHNKCFWWITCLFAMYELYAFIKPIYNNFNWDYLLMLYTTVITCSLMIINVPKKRKETLFSIISAITTLEICLYILIQELPAILEGGINRIGSSGSGNVNTIGTYLTIFAIPMLYQVIVKKEKKYLPIFIIQLIFILLTGSKKGLVLVLLGIIIIYLYQKGFKLRNMLKIALIVAFIIVMILKVGFLYNTIGFRIIDFLNTIGFNIEGAHNSHSTIKRISMYESVPSLFVNEPILGSGWGYFSKFSGLNVYSHSNYIEILITFGIVGFVLYYSMYVTILKKAFKKMKKHEMIIPFCYMLLFIVNDFLVITFSQVPIVYIIIFLLYQLLNNKQNINLNLIIDQKEKNMLNICDQLFELLNDQNITYCHWKSIEHLAEGLEGETDLDMLFVQEQKESIEKIFKQLNIIKFMPQKGSNYMHVEDWIGMDKETGKLIHIHLHYKIIAGKHFVKEYLLPLDKIILDNRIYMKQYNTYIINPNIEIILLTIRAMIKINSSKVITLKNAKYQFPNDIQKEFDYLYENIEQTKVQEFAKQIFSSNYEKITSIINNKLETKQLYELYRIILENIKPYKRISDLKAKVVIFYYRVYYKILNTFKSKLTYTIRKTMANNNGFSICFIGSDGCGKSTVSQNIDKWLSWKIECRRFYLGSGGNYKGIFYKIRKIVKKEEVEHKKAPSKEQIGNKIASKKGLKQYIKNIYSGLENIDIAKITYKTIKKVQKYNKKGGIAILDRFPQNQVEGIYDGVKNKKVVENFPNSKIMKYLYQREKKYVNKSVHYQPQLVFKLILEPEVSIARKPDHDYEEVKLKAKITKELKFDNSKVEEIDANMDYSSEIIKIRESIWSMIVEK